MPKVLGRYHIISELGRGGMGVVYKAVDPKLERFIAIKCLSDELSSDEMTVTRFLREARNVAALNHPHIAQIFLADEDEGKPYFVMEYIDGESLAERLARDRRLMPEQALRIINECAQALKAAHEENIVHRDIKPGNIMIDRRGRTVLTDFGIASIVHPDNQPKASKYIMGTPGYLPPEVMTGHPADHRGDIFALGAVYYEMLAGKRLVPGNGIEDTARTLLAADFPELNALDDQVDDFTFGVLGRMLAPDPDKRYQNYDDLLAGLRTEQVAVAPPSPDSEPTRLPSARQPSAASSPAAAEAAAATARIDSVAVEPPPTVTAPPPAGRSRVARYGMIGALLLGVAVIGLGAMRLAPEYLDQVTGWFDFRSTESVATSSSVADQPSAESDTRSRPEPAEPMMDLALVGEAAPDRGAAEAAPEADFLTEASASVDEAAESTAAGPIDAGPVDRSTIDGSTIDESAIDDGPRSEISASSALLVASAEPSQSHSPPSLSSDVDAMPASPATDPSAAGGPASAAPADQSAVASAAAPVSDTATTASSAPVRRTVEPAAQPAPRPEPVVVPASGVLVIGLGDPVFVDPMVREVEETLRADGHDIVERGYVAGLGRLIGGAELDLAGLSRAGADAGARYAVVVRAMPAGQRALEYYGRTDTLYMVQTETITYDLSTRRRLGASELEQIDYTALNATQRARESIAPRLALISEQLAR